MEGRELYDRLNVMAANVAQLMDSLSTQEMSEYGEDMNIIWNEIHDILAKIELIEDSDEEL